MVLITRNIIIPCHTEAFIRLNFGIFCFHRRGDAYDNFAISITTSEEKYGPWIMLGVFAILNQASNRMELSN